MDVEHHHIALAHAEHAYNKLVCALHEGVTAAHLLLDDKCNEASNYRGLLLGRPWGTGATFDELYVARLKTDISQSNIVVDVSQGVCSVTSSVEHMNHDQVSLELSKILNVILVSYPDDVKKRFRNKTVVNALFHVGKYQNNHEQYNLNAITQFFVLRKRQIMLL